MSKLQTQQRAEAYMELHQVPGTQPYHRDTALMSRGWLHPPLEMAYIISLTACIALLRGKTTRTLCRYWACWRYQPDWLPQVQDCHFDCWCMCKCRALPTLRMGAITPEPFKCRNIYPSTSTSSQHGDLWWVPLLCIISNIAGKCSCFVRLNRQ